MGVFKLLLIVTAVVVGGSVAWGVLRYNDTLHPLVVLPPAAGFLYVLRPWSLLRSGELQSFFQPDELVFIQGLFLTCTAALAFGAVVGSGSLRRDPEKMDRHAYTSTPAWRDRIYQLSLVLGGIGLVLYAYGLYNVGGVVAAYDAPKGGGWAASGYLRDFSILVMPATVLLFMARYRRWRVKHTLLITLYACPLLVHGLLSSRRGPTFMGLTVLVVGWYLTRRRRPSLWQVLLGGTAVGFLLLALVTFRGQIYLGSQLLTGQGASPTEVFEQTLDRSDNAGYGDEYIYGGYTALGARAEGEFYWGARYLTYVFIRPIPSAIWPTKYQDVGMEEMLANAGTLVSSQHVPAEKLPKGAAPGFASDLFIEFGWGAVAAALLVGWIYGVIWRRHLTHGGLWVVVYAGLLAFSLFFVVQTMGAALFRFLEILIPTAVGWWILEGEHVRARRRQQRLALD